METINCLEKFENMAGVGKLVKLLRSLHFKVARTVVGPVPGWNRPNYCPSHLEMKASK